MASDRVNRGEESSSAVDLSGNAQISEDYFGTDGVVRDGAMDFRWC